MFEFIHEMPLWCAKAGAAVLFSIVLAVTWLLPKNLIYSGAPDRSRWRDLRLWATALIFVQLLLYLVF